MSDEIISKYDWKDFARLDECPISLHIVHDLLATTPLHNHDFLEIALIASGTGIYLNDSGQYQLQPGDLFILPSGTSHQYLEEQHLHVYNLLIRTPSVLKLYAGLANTPAIEMFFNLEPKFRDNDKFKRHMKLNNDQLLSMISILDLMDEEFISHSRNCGMMIKALLWQFLILLERFYSTQSENNKDTLFYIAKTTSYIHDHLSEKIAREKLARIANMSEETFYRYFKLVTGQNPSDYIMAERLKRAEKLLRTSHDALSDIAAQCGFNDCAYFGLLFKRQFNASPAKYRRENNSNS